MRCRIWLSRRNRSARSSSKAARTSLSEVSSSRARRSAAAGAADASSSMRSAASRTRSSTAEATASILRSWPSIEAEMSALSVSTEVLHQASSLRWSSMRRVTSVARVCSRFDIWMRRDARRCSSASRRCLAPIRSTFSIDSNFPSALRSLLRTSFSGDDCGDALRYSPPPNSDRFSAAGDAGASGDAGPATPPPPTRKERADDAGPPLASCDW
mmetsp:Transcript_12442/g.24793  ORF Transcript_12442/g.24793 Transcript_12442/m.24793 type:complete len:214 (-) Transcript_12442:340-981(-)